MTHTDIKASLSSATLQTVSVFAKNQLNSRRVTLFMELFLAFTTPPTTPVNGTHFTATSA
jgi:hypothetical protein